MITWILIALLIFFAQTLLPPLFRYFLAAEARPLDPLGNRDNPPETSIYGKRAERALANSIEGYLIFLPLAVLLVAVPGDVDRGLLGTQAFVVCRLFYVGVYVAGIPVVRSILWTVGHIGLVLMALSL